MSDPRVTVVIPNYNGEPFLDDCLSSLQAQTFKDLKVIVVDNDSPDRSVPLIEERFPWVELIRTGSNLGFGAACNIGIRASRSELVILLNNDTKVDADFVLRLVRAMDEYPEASFGAAKMLRTDPPHVIDSAGDRFDLRGGGAINIGAGESGRLYTDRAWVFGAMAGAAIYRRSFFEDIGMFDEDFFLINEDTDLNVRAQAAGHRCIYVPDAIVMHKRGVSRANPPAHIRAISLRNRWWVVGKNLPGPILMIWLLHAARRGLREAIHIVATWMRGSRVFPKGYFEGYAPQIALALRKMLTKRRDVSKTRRVGNLELLRRINTVREPLDE